MGFVGGVGTRMSNRTVARKFVERNSNRINVVKGVETSTAAFVGPTLKGPVGGKPILVTSFDDYCCIFGGFDNLDFGRGEVTNYIAHSVFNFFANGGERLYIARVYSPHKTKGYAHSGIMGGDSDNHRNIVFRATTVGRFGNALHVTVTLVQSSVVRNAAPGSLMYADGRFYVRAKMGWLDRQGEAYRGGAAKKSLVTVNVLLRSAGGEERLYENMGFSPAHPRFIGDIFSVGVSEESRGAGPDLALVIGSRVTAFRLYAILRKLHGEPFRLCGGRDGAEPTAESYQRPLRTLTSVAEIAMVAAPGHTSFGSWEGIRQRLVDHVDAVRSYSFALLDPRPGMTPKAILRDRQTLQSENAALFYPWLVADHPLAQRLNPHIPKEVVLPPSGFVCGFYARCDNARGVNKAPSKELLRGAVKYEHELKPVHLERLNELGVNTPVLMHRQSYQGSAAQTTSLKKDEWRYVHERRYFLYLKHSIERSTQWVESELNTEEVWEAVVRQVSTFLYGEWRAGHLAGQSADEAFFVCCDHSTMEPEDVERGRVVVMVGFATIKPIDFSIFWVNHQALVTAEAEGESVT